MKIALATDHRGFKLKNMLGEYLQKKGYEIIDFGTHTPESCDYTDYVYPACKAVQARRADRAVILCYTGIGSCIAANKVKGIRAALAYSQKSAVFSRRHNNSNVLVLPSHFFTQESLRRVVIRWIRAEFEGGRHLRRVKKIRAIEEKENG
ncbi:MAG: ribose 5-phosphate isomerase B [Candidatus Omnitrophica bacterium]|nr:ribose 5-phosphate isomerase B [Candidatus Omnitrophota bacterium]